ncbi:hypothetical protein RJ639_013917 [Escallonia herrerae]|uniref:Retrotransposon gag domain-containing protein n=1 Tax=Escallonia herrerae TaxID=1293975 RepID=A0AA88VPA7_9ASTE|nr:hypothetical protein RJ639_013917 [Escallonia herrerae]
MFKLELKRQFYPESIKDMAMINLRRLRQKGSICEYVKEYSTLMLEIPEMSERQRLCFFVDGLQQWVATELRRNEPHDLASAIAIVKRLKDFKQRERPRSPRHKRAKDRGDSRLKIGSPKATDDEMSVDKGCHHHHKEEEKKHEGSPHCGRYCPHDGKMIAFLEKHKGSKRDSSNSDGEARMGTLQMVNAFVQKSKEEAAKEKKSKKRATHNFMSPRVAEWLRLKPIKDGSWFTTGNAEERPMKGVVKNVNLRTGGWTWKADFNIISMDELGEVLGMDFMEKSSATLNPY